MGSGNENPPVRIEIEYENGYTGIFEGKALVEFWTDFRAGQNLLQQQQAEAFAALISKQQQGAQRDTTTTTPKVVSLLDAIKRNQDNDGGDGA